MSRTQIKSAPPRGRKTENVQALFSAARNAPILDRQRELELAWRWKDAGDQAALTELTTAYLRLVIGMARKFRNYGLPIADLVQEGCIGLMEAAQRFEPERGLRFSTYANWWVRASMQDFVLRNWSIVRTGTTAAQKTLFFNLRRLRAQISNAGSDGYLGLEARTELARELGVKPTDVEAMEGRLAAQDRSLNSPAGEEGDNEWQDFLPSEDPQPDSIVMFSHDLEFQKSAIRHAVAQLSERESLIIRERRLAEDGVTLSELGKRLGVSKERVRQIEVSALEKIRTILLREFGGANGLGLSEAASG